VFKFKEKRENEYFHFVHISTLENNSKNTKGLLKAFKNLIDNNKKNLLTIISDGDISVAEQFISRFKISSKNIRLLKTQTAENIASFLQSADAYIQFSNYETFGLTIAEALCCGTPVISTRTGFLSEFKEFEIGLFVEAKNIEDLTKKMQLIRKIDYPYQKQSLYFSTLFNSQKIAQDYSELYQKVLNEY
jgi:glycosyltransferase involved in cell wall biosynthesis